MFLSDTTYPAVNQALNPSILYVYYPNIRHYTALMPRVQGTSTWIQGLIETEMQHEQEGSCEILQPLRVQWTTLSPILYI